MAAFDLLCKVNLLAWKVNETEFFFRKQLFKFFRRAFSICSESHVVSLLKRIAQSVWLPKTEITQQKYDKCALSGR